MASAVSVFSTPLHSSSSASSSWQLPTSFSISQNPFSAPNISRHKKTKLTQQPKQLKTHPSRINKRSPNLTCRAAEYKFPDPIPEFADAETEKFKNHLLNRLSKKDMFGDSVAEVVGVCTEIFSNFLHTEYGGPGTLLVIPFIDMADTLNERGLPGGPQAARAAVKWAQKYVDRDWKDWTSNKNWKNTIAEV